jgi:hypothetical protein
LVAAVGIEFEQKPIQAEQRAHQQHTAVAVLDVGRMDDGLQQQSLGVYQDMAFLALDLVNGGDNVGQCGGAKSGQFVL